MTDPARPPSSTENPDPTAAARALDDLEALLKRIPGATSIVKELAELRALLVRARPPRIAAVGRRGSGKSSVANALLGAEILPVGAVEDTTRDPTWAMLSLGGRRVRWLDTPGLRAGGVSDRSARVAEALKAERPDVVLFCARATELDAGVDADLEALSEIMGAEGLAKTAVLGVLTRVDELPPVAVKQPPYDQDQDKLAAITAGVEALRAAMERHGVKAPEVVPIGAWQRFRDGQRVVDWRWNLETLGAAIFTRLPVEAQVEASRAFERSWALRRKLAMRLVGTATTVSLVVGATALPVADLAVLVPLQGAMLSAVVYLSGRSLGPRAVSEWLGAMGLGLSAGMGLRELVRGVLKLVPGLGAQVSGAVAASGTWALGVSAVRYFIDGAGLEAARAAFETASRDGELPEGEDPGDKGA